MRIPFDVAVEALRARVLRPHRAPAFLRVVTDTRTLEPGDAFLALCGDRYDGHEFTDRAVERGAAAVIVARADTAAGDVTALVSGIDDRYAIFGSGEEIAAEFDATKLPTLPAHWTRDYFFYANGFVKDMDWWDASPFTVAQLPFHAMSKYPYPADEKFPDDANAIDYQLNWNNRWDSGEPVRSYRFDYQVLPSTPAEDTRP